MCLKPSTVMVYLSEHVKSCSLTTENIIFPLPHCHWLHDKLKPLYPDYHIANCHQTWQDGDLPWMVLTYKVKSRGNLEKLHLHLQNTYDQ